MCFTRYDVPIVVSIYHYIDLVVLLLFFTEIVLKTFAEWMDYWGDFWNAGGKSNYTRNEWERCETTL